METTVEIGLSDPTPIAFRNVYGKGDKWVKVKGCEACPDEQRAKCCGNCHFLDKGAKCRWHNTGSVSLSNKSFYCIVTPTPRLNDMKSPCAIVYKCVKGEHIGKFRHVSDKRGVLRDA